MLVQLVLMFIINSESFEIKVKKQTLGPRFLEFPKNYLKCYDFQTSFSGYLMYAHASKII